MGIRILVGLVFGQILSSHDLIGKLWFMPELEHQQV